MIQIVSHLVTAEHMQYGAWYNLRSEFTNERTVIELRRYPRIRTQASANIQLLPSRTRRYEIKEENLQKMEN